MVKGSLVLAALALLALGVTAAQADEAKTVVKASMLLTISRVPVEAREVAYDRTLKDAGPAPRSPLAEVLPDGSVKVDRAVITVRNPCPPGTMHYDPAPLPGRRAKN
ncbi:MAG TPA: hypothetical protein VK548_04700 [Candidatus Acidoferrum sp.]|nr:hypothetical protein [Candidatus Acidoferrum sp.]